MYSKPLSTFVTVSVVLAVTLHSQAETTYEFEVLATLGDPDPGGDPGDTLVFDFEANEPNNLGQVMYGADLSAGGEGLYLRDPDGQTTVLGRTSDAAPGTGKTYGGFFIGPGSLNNHGDAAFVFALEPAEDEDNPAIGAGVFRYSGQTKTVSTVYDVLGNTPAPGGGHFVGATLRPSLNDNGDLAFAALTTAANTVDNEAPGVQGKDIGVGVFRQDSAGNFTSVVRPGDAAPGGGTFDFAENPWINGLGDVAFGGHEVGETCVGSDLASQAGRIFCGESVYLKPSAGDIISIAHQGDPAPGGDTYRLAFGPVINDQRQMLSPTLFDPAFPRLTDSL